MLKDKSYFIRSFFVRLLGLEDGLVSHHKPKLIFLHGLLGNIQNWISVARALENRFTILLIDQRGHGKTGALPGDFHPKDFSEDLLLVTQELGWDKFSAVGHSLGARTLFYFGAHYPEKLEKLVIEDMGPHITGKASTKTVDMLDSVPVPFEDRKKAKDFFYGEFLKQRGKVMADYLYSNIQETAEGFFDWRFDLQGAYRSLEIGRSEEFWGEYKKIKVPTFVVKGEKSEHLPLDEYKKMLDLNKDARGVIIKNAGHWVHFDQRDEFIKQIDQFL